MLTSTERKLKSNSNPNMMLRCTTCGFYSHLRCSRVSPETLEEIENGQEGENHYKCLDCILNGKTINNLSKEVCDHYENIH